MKILMCLLGICATPSLAQAQALDSEVSKTAIMTVLSDRYSAPTPAQKARLEAIRDRIKTCDTEVGTNADVSRLYEQALNLRQNLNNHRAAQIKECNDRYSRNSLPAKILKASEGALFKEDCLLQVRSASNPTVEMHENAYRRLESARRACLGDVIEFNYLKVSDLDSKIGVTQEDLNSVKKQILDGEIRVCERVHSEGKNEAQLYLERQSIETQFQSDYESCKSQPYEVSWSLFSGNKVETRGSCMDRVQKAGFGEIRRIDSRISKLEKCIANIPAHLK